MSHVIRRICLSATVAATICMTLLPRTALAAREEPENTPDPKTRVFPHIDWCRAPEGGAPRVLFIANSPSAWDVYGLAMRMDLDYDVFYTGERHSLFAPKTDYYGEGIRLYPQAVNDLKALLDEDWDVIAFVDTPPYCLPPEIHYLVIKKISEGCGAVTFNCARWATHFKRPNIRRSTLDDLFKSMPMSAFSQMKPMDDDDAKPVINRTNGERLLLSRPVRTPLTLSPPVLHEIGQGRMIDFIVGGGNWSGGPAMQPALPQSPEELIQAEYFYSMAAKLVLQAAGRSPSVRATLDTVDGKTFAPGIPFDINVGVSRGFAGDVVMVLRTPQRDIVHDKRSTVSGAPDTRSIALPAPALPAGRYYADVWLEVDGKTTDWASAHFTVASPASRITACQLAQISFAATDPLTATVTVDQAPAGGSITARIYDAFDRLLVERKDIPLAQGKAAISLSLARTREQYHVLDVALVAGVQAIDRQRQPFFVTRPPDTNEVFVFSSGDGYGLHGKRRFDIYRDYGINALQKQDGQVDQAIASGCQLAARRVVVGHCSPWEGGCISGRDYPASIEHTFKQFATRFQPYGLKFLSIGDDSGVGSDFCTTYPSWVRAYVVKLSQKHGGNIRAYTDGNKTGHIGAFRYMLAQANLQKILAYPRIEGDLQLMKEAWRESYGSIAAFNRASGTTFASFDAVGEDDLGQLKYVSQCVLGFRDAMQAAYGTVAALNKAWGTDLASFEEITNALVEGLVATKQFTAKLDKTWYLQELILRNMEAIARGARAAVPDVGIGMGAASIGDIVPDSLEHVDSVMPYKGDRDIEIIRSAPHRFCGHTVGVYGGKKVAAAARENQVWEILFTGGNFIWFWDVMAGGVMGDLSTNPGRSGVMLENIREVQQGIGRALVRGDRLHDGIAILDSRRAGALSGFHKTFGTMASAQVAFQRIIEDLGLQYRYTWTKEVEKGVLRSGEFKVLILPSIQILSELEEREIRAFVEGGGTVIADLRTGTHDWAGRARPQGTLDDLFGIHQNTAKADPVKGALVWGEGAASHVPGLRADASVKAKGATALAHLENAPSVLTKSTGKGRTIFLNHAASTYNILLNRGQAGELRKLYRSLFAMGGVQRRFRVVDNEGNDISGAEIAVFKNGPIEYLTLEKNSCEFESYPLAATIELDRTYHVYNTRTGEAIGETDSIPLALSGLGCYVYTLLPYAVETFAAEVPTTVARGGEAIVEMALGSVAKTPGPHTLRVDVFQPDGKRLWPMYKLETIDGKATVRLPISLDEKTGPWKVVATDVTTGRQVTQTMTVTE